MLPITNFPVGKAYDGPIEISIEQASEDQACSSGTNGIIVHMYTEDLYLRSVQACDIDNYCALMGDEETVKNYASGKPTERAEVEKRVNDWVARWQSGNPFSALAVFKKTPDSTCQDEPFIGHIIAGSGECMWYGEPGKYEGYSEMAGLEHKRYRNAGYARQAAAALISKAIPEYQQKGYRVNTIFSEERICKLFPAKKTFKLLPLNWVTATAAPDNSASVRLLTGLGFECKNVMENLNNRTGGVRAFFALKV
ncbi:GNAT family N-acetyltransferase [Endozoicomonas sp. SCSIO W0465]|uniref:GNAT family N-acetyltransferase n=1 Tax=Endozoicomonas sp. SCSIO W0465 TaxID=2918516 RepID=UPI0020760C1A|nr:GNAT family N-acetyltransferase [Endozoicomonas sp. SCSIO W0465]USE34782.1 GNAT family N-acetyltransferase [Endozoicomonas sp. SCSIO W0465]